MLSLTALQTKYPISQSGLKSYLKDNLHALHTIDTLQLFQSSAAFKTFLYLAVYLTVVLLVNNFTNSINVRL